MATFRLDNSEELYYEVYGSGARTLIMVHGWTSSSHIFQSAAKKIAKETETQVILYDQRGHGHSRNANREHVQMETLGSDLNELITELSLENITLLGWSMGACTVMNYVRAFGCDAIDQIILCDMTPRQINQKGWRLGLYKGHYTKEDQEASKKRDFEQILTDFILNTMPRLKRFPKFVTKRAIKYLMENNDPGVLESLMDSMGEQDNRDVIPKISVPFTYFYPTPGTIYSPKLKDWYEKNIQTDFKSVSFPGGHTFVFEARKQFADELIKIMR